MTTLATSPRRKWDNTFLDGWLTVLLLAGIAFCTAVSIERAKWVKDSSPLEWMVFLGLLLGGLLASTRWKGRFAGLYAFLAALLLAAQFTARVLPAPWDWFSAPLADTVQGIRVRAYLFSFRLSDWVALLRQGRSVTDSGTFILAFSALVCLAFAWLAWWELRHHRALAGLLPSTFLMALNVQLNRQERALLLAFLFLAILLIARGAFLEKQADWQKRKVDFAEELGVDWGTSAFLGGILVALAALAFSYLGTVEGWRALDALFQESRQKASDTAQQVFKGVNPPPPDENDETWPSISPPDLALIGAAPAQGSATVFTVWVSDPAPLPEEAREAGAVDDIPRHYWRSAIYTTYTGQGWDPATTSGALPAAESFSSETPAPPGRYWLTQRYRIVGLHGEALFGVNQPVRAGSGMRLESAGEDSSLVRGAQDQYEVVSAAGKLTIAQMESAGTDYPAGIRSAYLQLPSSLPGRVAVLAAQVAGSGTPYEKAERIQDYLRRNYAYDLSAGVAPAGEDAVDYFLFTQQRGFCSHFSSAMAVMLRVVGVPARVVSGYASGYFDPQAGEYVVPVSASHAWVEIYFPGYGWVEFEPTPAYATFPHPEGLSFNAGSSSAGPTASPPARTFPVLPWLAAGLGLAALLWLLVLRLRKAWSRPGPPDTQAEIAYRQARRDLVQAGLVHAGNLTPGEFLEVCRGPLQAYPRLSAGLLNLTEVYIRAAYSPRLPTAGEVDAVRRAWRRASWERLKLLWRRRSRPGAKDS